MEGIETRFLVLCELLLAGVSRCPDMEGIETCHFASAMVLSSVSRCPDMEGIETAGVSITR